MNWSKIENLLNSGELTKLEVGKSCLECIPCYHPVILWFKDGTRVDVGDVESGSILYMIKTTGMEKVVGRDMIAHLEESEKDADDEDLFL